MPTYGIWATTMMMPMLSRMTTRGDEDNIDDTARPTYNLVCKSFSVHFISFCYYLVTDFLDINYLR